MQRNSGSINPEIVSHKVSPTHHHLHDHDNLHRDEYYQQQYDQQSGDQRDGSRVQPIWREKQKRRKQRKQIFGDHYNYNYRKPIQHKMYRIQQNRNTQIQRANRILLQKIQSIFKRSMGKKKARQMTVAMTSQATSQAATNIKTQNAELIHRSANQIKNKRNILEEQEMFEQKKNKRSNRNSTVERLGNLNKDLQLAKRELYRQEKLSKNFKAGELSKQASLNKNLIKLQEIESIGHKKRRFQTEMNQPTQKNKKNKTINKLEAANTKPNIYQKQIDSIPTAQNQSRQHITSRSNLPTSPYNISPILEQKPPKIILFREKNIKIGHKVFDIQAYVEGNTYLISAMSLNENNQQFHQLITMPYINYQELYKAKLTQNHENIIHYLQIQKRNGLLQVRGFERKYMDIFEQGEVQVNADNGSTGGHKSRMQERKNFIVHYNNNPDDTFDRITLINSENNTNSIPPSINQLQSQQKKMNNSRYNKPSNRQSRVSVKKQINKQIQVDKQMESRVQTKRKTNSNNQNFVNRQESKQIKSETVPIQRQKQKIMKKEICTMTDNMLPPSQQVYEDPPKDVANNMSMNSSNVLNNSKVMKKSPTLSSNLINIHIQPSLITSPNGDNRQQNRGTKMQQNDSSFFSDITMSNKNRNKLNKQEEQLLLDNVHINENKKKKTITPNQYQDIEDIISDSGLK